MSSPTINNGAIVLYKRRSVTQTDKSKKFDGKKKNYDKMSQKNHKSSSKNESRANNYNISMKGNPSCNKIWNKLSNSIKYNYEKNITNNSSVTSEMIEKYTDYFKFIMLHTHNIDSFIKKNTNVLISSVINIQNKILNNERGLLILIESQRNKQIFLCYKKDNCIGYNLNDINILSKDSINKEKLIYKISIVINGNINKTIIFESKRERNRFTSLVK